MLYHAFSPRMQLWLLLTLCSILPTPILSSPPSSPPHPQPPPSHAASNAASTATPSSNTAGMYFTAAELHSVLPRPVTVQEVPFFDPTTIRSTPLVNLNPLARRCHDVRTRALMCGQAWTAANAHVNRIAREHASEHGLESVWTSATHWQRRYASIPTEQQRIARHAWDGIDLVGSEMLRRTQLAVDSGRLAPAAVAAIHGGLAPGAAALHGSPPAHLAAPPPHAGLSPPHRLPFPPRAMPPLPPPPSAAASRARGTSQPVPQMHGHWPPRPMHRQDRVFTEERSALRQRMEEVLDQVVGPRAPPEPRPDTGRRVARPAGGAAAGNENGNGHGNGHGNGYGNGHGNGNGYGNGHGAVRRDASTGAGPGSPARSAGSGSVSPMSSASPPRRAGR